MRNIRKIALLAVMLSACVLGGVHSARAQDAAASAKIAVLDDQKILSTSLAAKNIDSQLKARRTAVEKELATLERNLADTKSKLDAQKDKVKPADVEAFRKSYAEARQLADNRRQELEQAANGALGKMRTAITKIVTDMAKKNGYVLVLTRQNVVLADAGLDITDAVLAQLDKDLPAVSVDFAEAKKAASK